MNACHPHRVDGGHQVVEPQPGRSVFLPLQHAVRSVQIVAELILRRTGTRGPARCVGRIARDADIEIGGIMIVERMDCGGISSGVVLPARERPGGRAVFGIAAKDLRLVTELFVEVVEMNPGDPAAQLDQREEQGRVLLLKVVLAGARDDTGERHCPAFRFPVRDRDLDIRRLLGCAPIPRDRALLARHHYRESGVG